ncbi:MAG: twin-arginine translocase subunit TatC [Lentisphaeria bacterium]|nr:twin-arginine translocase subunit TatC [Lentisphaeria bacterium]
MPDKDISGTGGSLLEHLESFRWTLLWSLGAVCVCAVPGIIFIPGLLLKYVRYVCPPGMSMHYFTPFEPLIVQLELGFFAGVILALPFILYKIAEFVVPGLYQHERRWVFFFLLSSLILTATGAALALGVVIPIVMQFSNSFAADALQPVIGLAAFLHFSALLAGGFALIFELPVALLLAIRFGVISVETLRSKRPLIIVALFFFAAILTPPDVVSQLLMGVPGWILFELTLLIGSRIALKEECQGQERLLPIARAERREPEDEEYNTAVSDSAAAVPAEPYIDDMIYRSAARKKRKIRHL